MLAIYHRYVFFCSACVDPQKKNEYRKRANDYLTRAEELKEQLRQSKKQEAEPKEKLSTSKKQEEAGGGSLKDHVQVSSYVQYK